MSHGDPLLPVTGAIWLATVQRLPSVVVRTWVHGVWLEAVTGSPCSAAESMIGIEGAAVMQSVGKSPIQCPVPEYGRGELLASGRPIRRSSTRIVAASSTWAPCGRQSFRFHPRSRSALLTTLTLLSAMAAPATTGLSRPAAASGMPITLYAKAQNRFWRILR
ncbi:hypothetical protein D9M68_735520 [compost metagenome]